MSITQGLFAFGGKLYAAWKGEVGDDRLFYASFNGTSWEAASTQIPGNSSVGPSIAATSGSALYAAWKGENGDNDQRLFYSVFNGSTWQAQVQISNVGSSVGPSLGVLNGVLYAAWKGEEGDNQLYWSWLNGSTWEPQQPISGASSLVGPSLAAYDGKLYAGWRGAVNDQSLHFAEFNGSSWASAPAIPGGSSVGPSLAAFGSSLYAAWRGEEGGEGIYYASFSNGAWSGQTQIANVGSSTGPALAAFGSNLYAMWKGEGNDQSLYYASFNGSWSGQNTLPGNTGQDSVPVPESGLTDNSNYWISSNCNPITGLSVTIEVTQNMVWESTSRGGGVGFSFQLNAFSQIGSNIIPGWQQFVYFINAANSPAVDFRGQFESWPSQSTINGISTGGSDLINLSADVQTLQTNGVKGVPAGFKLTISLGTDGSSRVSAAEFSVTDPNANNGNAYSTTIKTVDQNPPPQLDGSLPKPLQGPITDADIAPILAFQLVLVGPAGCAVKLSSGAATVTYTASTALTALNAPPSCVKNTWTGEAANSVYSTMLAGSGTSITQTFWVAS